ncbi:hypothetical protein GP486_008325, partial [Trichoglossum hirsutum]
MSKRNVKANEVILDQVEENQETIVETTEETVETTEEVVQEQAPETKEEMIQRLGNKSKTIR